MARLWRKNGPRFNERMADILNGPTLDALNDPVKVYCKPSESYYDNFLPQELDSFICGQYISPTSK